jgi:drug/metabolite transporter (DMT)-like permease
MGAITGGIVASLMWTPATLCSSRSSQLIGAPSAVAWVMTVGLVLTSPIVLLTGSPHLHAGSIALLAVSGTGNMTGLLLVYAAMRVGKVSIVAAIVATEGAVAAVIAVIGGEILSPAVGATLALVVVGVVLAARREDEPSRAGRGHTVRATYLAIGAATVLGVSLYATGKVSTEVPLAWVLLPARLLGVLVVAIPLAVTSRLKLTRAALPLVLAGGTCETLGVACFTLAARHGIAVASVLVSQVAALTGVAAYLLFGERIGRAQVFGVAAIVVGVSVLSALHP